MRLCQGFADFQEPTEYVAFIRLYIVLISFSLQP